MHRAQKPRLQVSFVIGVEVVNLPKLIDELVKQLFVHFFVIVGINDAEDTNECRVNYVVIVRR